MIKVIAHRGASAYEPENTLRSFKKGLEMKVDLIEMDVRLSKDKKLVVIHDEALDRTTNGKGFVRDFTLEQLKQLDAGLGEKIPTLQEAIDLIKGKADMIIELKEDETEKGVVKMVMDNNIEDKVVLGSFSVERIAKVKKLNPSIATGIITATEPFNVLRSVIETKSQKISVKTSLINEKLIKESHKNKITVISWTVDEPEEMRRLFQIGVDEIASNKPNIVIKEFNRFNK